MDVSSSESLAVFALAAVPGVVVLEIIWAGRPRLRDRGTARTFAIYLVMSAAAWGVATLLFDAKAQLSEVIELESGQADQLVVGYSGLALKLVAAAAVTGIALRAASWVCREASYRLASRSLERESRPARTARRLLGGVASAPYAWDGLLAELKKAEEAQIVHVRLRDGGNVYGVFAAAGRADYEADGRGLLLDREIVPVGGRLVDVAGSTGVFVASDAIASVSFAAVPEAISSDRPLHSKPDD